VGDWQGMIAAAPRELPPWIAGLVGSFGAEPPQNLKEYDPEWARAFWTGSVAASCDHARMLSAVKVPVLLTHHFRNVDEASGLLMGALSDLQAARVRELVTAAGQAVDYRSFPTMGHSMHGQDRLFRTCWWRVGTPASASRSVTRTGSAILRASDAAAAFAMSESARTYPSSVKHCTPAGICTRRFRFAQ
jgi:hypothetical protein